MEVVGVFKSDINQIRVANVLPPSHFRHSDNRVHIFHLDLVLLPPDFSIIESERLAELGTGIL